VLLNYAHGLYFYGIITIIPSGINVNALLLRKKLRVLETAAVYTGIQMGVYAWLGWSN
jgi:hypothetical protein